MAAESIREVQEMLGRSEFDFVALHINCDVDPSGVMGQSEGTALHGATSCLGAMTETADCAAVAAFAIADKAGAYGSAMVAIGDDGAEAAARAAAMQAQAQADRTGERPDLVWVSSTPGEEEAVLAGIESVVGRDVPIIGGSAADNSVEGNWFVFDSSHKSANGVMVSVLYPSAPVSFAYQNGYSPTEKTGKVTKVDGRRVFEIDGRPALDVYTDWTGGAVARTEEHADPQAILSDSTLWPLGRPITSVGSVPFYLLAHPATAHGDGALDMFATMEEGEDITMMTGTVEGLCDRAGRVASLARATGGRSTQTVKGALMIYCGGCMLTVRHELPQVTKGVREALDGAPFLGAFTFGEQGPLIGAGNRHGNLMISCIVFG